MAQDHKQDLCTESLVYKMTVGDRGWEGDCGGCPSVVSHLIFFLEKHDYFNRMAERMKQDPGPLSWQVAAG